MQNCLLAVLLFACAAFSAGLGTYSAGMERIPATAHAWGVGNAVSANPEYGAALINPAKLAFSSGFGLSLTNTVRPLGRYENMLSLDYKIPQKRVGVGTVFSYKGISDLDGLRYDGEVYNSTNYVNTALKIGVGTVLTAKWSLGFSASWYYSKIPVGFVPDSRDIQTNSSSTLGGLTLMTMYKNNRGFFCAFGLRDIFSYSDWSYKDKTYGTEMINTVMDTMPMLLVAAAQYDFTVLDKHEVKLSADFNGYLLNSFFRAYDHAALVMNYGFEWSPNDIISFRTGIRDILINRNLAANRLLWRTQNNPRFGFGIGVNLENVSNWKLSRKFGVNYALANSGAQAGIEHSFDIAFRW